jgi:hypothetical protein
VAIQESRFPSNRLIQAPIPDFTYDAWPIVTHNLNLLARGGHAPVGVRIRDAILVFNVL